jgi:hypothetical protein
MTRQGYCAAKSESVTQQAYFAAQSENITDASGCRCIWMSLQVVTASRHNDVDRGQGHTCDLPSYIFHHIIRNSSSSHGLPLRVIYSPTRRLIRVQIWRSSSSLVSKRFS